MKATGLKHLLRSIRKSGVSFLAVAVIAGVSIAIFQGFQSSAHAILRRADQYFVENRLETLEISCANGVTQEDIDAIAGWDGVRSVEGGYTDSALLDLGSERVLVQARSLLETMNTPVIIEGELPTAADEAAIEERLAAERGIKVGDSITLENDGCLLETQFTVTAIVNLPVYVCAGLEDTRGTADAGLGSNEYFVALDKCAFDADNYSDCYTTAYIDSSKFDGVYYFSDEYESAEDEYIAALEPLAEERAALRYESLSAEVQDALNEAQAEIDDAKAEIADGEQELADGRTEIEENRKKLEDARAEIADAEAEIADAETEIASGQRELDSSKAEFAENEQALADAKAELDAQLGALGLGTDLDAALVILEGYGEQGAPLMAAIQEFKASEAQLEAARSEIASAEATLASSRSELANAKAELADAYAEVADGEAELAEAEQELADGEAELEDAKAELADGEAEFADAQADAAELKESGWIISGRNEVGDVRGVETIVKAIFGLSYAMSAVFLIVSVLVCFAAITRVIREQRVLIGAQKALGFTAGELFRHFTLYNLVCAVLGVLVGWLLSVVIVEYMSLYIFMPKFTFKDASIVFVWSTALISAVICIAVFLAATFFTCSKLVKEPATELLRGEVPSKGGRMFFDRWGIYRKLSLFSRSIVKNVLSDKGRMLTTVMGIMGCTALLVACFTIKLGIKNASVEQFGTYSLYDYRLSIDTATGSASDFEALLDEGGVENLLIQDKLENFRAPGGDWDNAHVLTVSDAEALKNFMYLKDLDGGAEITVPEEGVLISRKAAEALGLAAGGTVEVMDESGEAHSFDIVAVVESYLPYHTLIMSSGYYEEVMGEAPDESVFLIKGGVDGIRAEAEGMTGFVSLRDNSEFVRSGSELDLAIYICVGLAAALSVLVLLNQITMHIDHKARELAVMRVNGYTLAQTRAYVSRDNVVLTVLGLLLGCLAGIGLGYIDTRMVEAGAEHYVRDPNLLACLESVAIVGVFAVIVNIIALRRIDKLNLTNVSSN